MALRSTQRKPTFDPAKPFAWSYSKLKNYESCPKRHLEVDILKNFQDSSEQLIYGNAIHGALADAIGNKGNKYPNSPAPLTVPLPAHYVDELAGWPEKYIALRSRNVLVATEMDLAITSGFRPSEWFGSNAWYRAKVDVLAISEMGKGNLALIADWKTGKLVDDSPQLRMSALVVFAHFPNVQIVESKFIWLKTDEETTERIRREDSVTVWNQIAPRVKPLHGSYTLADPSIGFPAKPGYLCRKYCPVKSCIHNGK